MSFEVATPAVRAAGRSMRSAGQQLARLRPHDHLDLLLTALPRSLSAATASRLAAFWRGRFERTAHAIELHGDALATAADDYELADSAVDTALGMRTP